MIKPKRIINIAKLQSTLDFIIANPKEWDQTSWFCGTSACFAGRAMLQSGYHSCASNYHFYAPNETSNQAKYVREAAMVYLGLTETQAVELFCGQNYLDDLKRIVKSLIVKGKRQMRDNAKRQVNAIQVIETTVKV